MGLVPVRAAVIALFVMTAGANAHGFNSKYDCLLDGLTVGKQDKKVYSQFGQDGILEYIFQCIGIESKMCVEFGAEPNESTTLHLIKQGWNSLRLDGVNEDTTASFFRHNMTAENIGSLMQQHGVHPENPLDLLVVDVDMNTFWVLAGALAAGYRPRVFVTEINRNFLPHQSYVIPYDANNVVWGANCYHGASATAFERLARRFGYSPIALEMNGIDAFFILNSEIGGAGVQTVGDISPYPPRVGEPNVWKLIHLNGCKFMPWLHVPEPYNLHLDAGRHACSRSKMVMLDHREWRDMRIFYEVPGLPSNMSRSDLT